MVSYIDILFLIVAVINIVAYVKKGFVVALVGIVRFIVIVPLSYFLMDYIRPYIPSGVLGGVPKQLQSVVVFFICLLLLYIVSLIIIAILKKLQRAKHMPLKHINAILGGVFGFAKACVFIVLCSLILGAAADFIPKDMFLYEIINNSVAVHYINSINLIDLGGLL